MVVFLKYSLFFIFSSSADFMAGTFYFKSYGFTDFYYLVTLSALGLEISSSIVFYSLSNNGYVSD